MEDGPDSGRSLVVAAAAFFTMTVLSGIVRAQGLLFVELISFYGVGRQEALLPFSVKSSMRNIFAPVVGVLGQRYGVAAVALTGAVLNSLSSLLSSLAPNIGWMTVTWGILGGASNSLYNCLIPVVIGQYFVKHRTTATGFVYSGSSVGAFLMPVIMGALLFNYGLQGTYYLLAGLYLHGVPAAMLFTKPKWTTKDAGEYESPTRKLEPNMDFSDEKLSGDAAVGKLLPESGKQLFPESGHVLDYLLPDSGRVLEQCLPENGHEQNQLLSQSGCESNELFQESGKKLKQLLPESGCELKQKLSESESELNKPLLESGPKLNYLFSKSEPKLNKISTENDYKTQQILSMSRSELNKSLPEGRTDPNHPLLRNESERNKLLPLQDPADTDLAISGANNIGKFYLMDSKNSPRLDPAPKVLDSLVCASTSVDTHCDATGLLFDHINSKVVAESDPELKIGQDTSAASAKTPRSAKTFETEELISRETPPGKLVGRHSLLHHAKHALKMYSKPIFLLICFSRFAFSVTFSPFVTTVVDFAIDRGMPETEAVATLLVLSAGDLVGRLCSGWITDRRCVELPRFMLVALLLQGMSCILITLTHTKVTLLCAIALFGVLQGSLYIRHFILVAEYLEADEQAIAMGCMDFFAGLVGIFPPLYIGYFRDVIGSYNPLHFLNGALCR